MVNSKAFAKRLEEILEYYELSASAFARRIDVQPSGISHLISGRNKPSLEFVMKVITAFPEVELYWLLNGKGSFPPAVSAEKPEAASAVTPPDIPAQGSGRAVTGDTSPASRKVERIIVCYTDGTFEAYKPS